MITKNPWPVTNFALRTAQLSKPGLAFSTINLRMTALRPLANRLFVSYVSIRCSGFGEAADGARLNLEAMRVLWPALLLRLEYCGAPKSSRKLSLSVCLFASTNVVETQKSKTSEDDMKISSVEDFAIALKQEQIPVLSTVPSDVLEEFRLNLRFVNERLAHAEYSMLHGHIPDDKLSELFSYFGIDHARFELIKDSSCVGSRCFVHPGSFCDPEVCER